MCMETKKQERLSSSPPLKDGDDHPNSDVTTEPTLPRGCCGTKPQVESGRDLGVGEESLEDRSGLVSRWMLSYLTPLLQLGSHKVLDAQDIGVPSETDRAERAFSLAKEAWEVQVAKVEAANIPIRQKYQAAFDACKTDEEKEKVPPPKLKEPSIFSALVKGFGISKIILAIAFYIMSAVSNTVHYCDLLLLASF